jgi:hypothetical protein
MKQAVMEPASQSWHMKFAMAANNRAWELAEKNRSPEENQEMLHAAHAAAWHWRVVGTELHHMRAAMLLAQVHALLGDGPSAWPYAQVMNRYFLSQNTADWELAFSHAVYAHAACIAGQQAIYIDAYAQARAAFLAIANAEDKAIVEKTFRLVPAPSI